MGGEILLARQPILDRDLEVVAYDLQYRAPDREPGAGPEAGPDPDAAARRVISEVFSQAGLDRLVGVRPAVIQVGPALLRDELRLALPPGRVLLELTETPVVDTALVEAVAGLARRGHRFALGDFYYTDPWEPVLRMADAVMLDVEHLNRFQIERQVAALEDYPVLRVATGVATPERHRLCRDLGFDAFQGAFLCAPEPVPGRAVPTAKLAVLRLMADLADPEIDADRLEARIGADAALSYRLLRFINAPFFPLVRKVESIHQAVVLLGLEGVRQWATLISLAGLSDKPHALLVTAMVRARMAEALARAVDAPHPGLHFTTGLFSVLGAMVDRPLEEVIAALPLRDEIPDALLHGAGPAGPTLACVLAYEKADFGRVASSEAGPAAARDAYVEAVAWADATAAALGHGG